MLHKLSRIIICMLALLPVAACSDNDEPIEENTLQSAEITYTYVISEDMLKYFNITAIYTNSDNQTVGKQITSTATTITTSATRFPANRSLTFTVTRTDVAPPAEIAAWSTTMAISVTKRYKDGDVRVSSKNDGSTVTPRPETFDKWAESFIKVMATGYPVTINQAGDVIF